MASRGRILAIAAVGLSCAAALWFVAADRGSPVPHRPAAPRPAPAPAAEHLPPAASDPGPARDASAAEPSADPPEGGEFLRGEVVLASGRPAVGARVLAWGLEAIARGEKAVEAGRARAGADGRVAIPIPAIDGRLVVYAALPGLCSAGALVPADRPRAEFRIVLGKGGILVGTLIGHDGAAVPRHEVRLWPARRRIHGPGGPDWRAWSTPGIWEEFGARTTTDAAGRFRFEGLPLPRNGVPQSVAAVARDADGREWQTAEVSVESEGEERRADLRMGEEPRAEDAAEPPAGFDPIRRGRVVDAASGEPIAGAHVKFVALHGESWSTWGAGTARDGSFQIDVGRFRPAGHRLEYRVWVEGRRPWRGPAGEGETVIGMEAESGRPAPGRIRGVARLPDGTALSGTLVVTLLGEMLDWHHRWTVADAAGGFLLEGVAPGEWQVRVKGSRKWSAASVPEGGEAAIAVVVDDPPEPPPPWTEERERELALLEREILVLDRRRTAGETEAPGADRPAEPIEHQMRVLHERIAPLEESRRASLPRREVEVQGLPDEPYATLEASGHGRVWVREASEGRVRFPPLEVGGWTLTLRRRTAYPDVRTIEVVDGDGPMIEQFAEVQEFGEKE